MTKYEEVSQDSITYVKLRELEVGSTFEGIFEGTTQSENFDNAEHNLRQIDGTKLVINGSALLNGLLKQISVGNQIKIEYVGKTHEVQTGKFKGTLAHAWKVFDGGNVVGGVQDNAQQLPTG